MFVWLLAACVDAPQAPTPWDLAQAREVPDDVQGRLAVHLRSDLLGVGAHGDAVLLTDGPGRAHLGVLSVLGTPKLTVHSDGLGVAIRSMPERRQWQALDADRVLHETTGGLLGLTEVVGLLVGTLPRGAATFRSETVRADGALVLLDGPAQGTLAIDLDTAGRPLALLATNARGRTVTRARWSWSVDLSEPLPLGVQVEVPPLDLVLGVEARSWTHAGAPPEAFSLRAPEGWWSTPLEWTGRSAVRAGMAALLAGPLDPDPASDTMGAEEGR